MVCAEATYKLVDMRIPLYVLLIEDGNGQSEIAALGLLVNAQRDTFHWFINNFKECNPACSKTRVFITDKDMKERSVILSLFPTSRFVIFLFHTPRTFNREITCEKLGITPDERDSIKKLIEQLCYCKNEKEYQEIYTIFLSQAPHQVKMYFAKNWHDITDSNTISLVPKLPTKKIENSDEYKYSMLLTHYAYNYLKKGLSCSNKT